MQFGAFHWIFNASYQCHDIDAVHGAPGAETGNVSLSSGVRQELVKVTARQVYRLWLHFWFPVACNQALHHCHVTVTILS